MENTSNSTPTPAITADQCFLALIKILKENPSYSQPVEDYFQRFTHMGMIAYQYDGEASDGDKIMHCRTVISALKQNRLDLLKPGSAIAQAQPEPVPAPAPAAVPPLIVVEARPEDPGAKLREALAAFLPPQQPVVPALTEERVAEIARSEFRRMIADIIKSLPAFK